MSMIPRLLRRMAAVLAGLALLLVALAVSYRWVPPPGSPLMAIRLAQGAPGIDRRWVPLDAISPHLVAAVVASEDSRFCTHHGIDWDAVEAARDHNEAGGRLRGASTLSMQTAKNAFLWPDRTWLRKGAELGFTLLIEATWPKRRIAEVYLNLAEWGDGIFGAEAAARRHFGKPAADLSAQEAALLAAVLPNPRRWSPERPTAYIRNRAATIERRMAIVRRDGLAACILDPA
ncbi:monofunctional biosynthetic peptidoglycan transglycosylase [Rhodospirillum centenum]|uniref:Biosynthetic peptidoglycan transglycosylase n=1 Tax=Rhodospirillum centenum (strain ATCC 51521 / SW) TaxID=414684 RepID=MTGA_RHOCS|nr:monofunctional biosynthetic peptidoglycan transglycosylase [Rhodospirillum centenum]B6IWJ6.1 RecName: Full=Biosynthetic peptidoglycan transglycosylase; AltName: Full=Glycan polymerase; AltName: Full=Peptidoglycan glycosyltransferase MtgA; Short=PGT [Rhodospirillum centenum SW]ACJ00670.1 monofunctional biosynthetic peptidoglycan transglycosylase, putative [Rhodospirillum centenum SW]